jgi:hypothetical protein
MVLFVAVARVRVFGAVGSAVAEPVVKSVAAAEFAFCAVLVARKGGQDRGRDHTDRHDQRHHEAQDSFQSCFDHFPFLLLLYSIFPCIIAEEKNRLDLIDILWYNVIQEDARAALLRRRRTLFINLIFILYTFLL